MSYSPHSFCWMSVVSCDSGCMPRYCDQGIRQYLETLYSGIFLYSLEVYSDIFLPGVSHKTDTISPFTGILPIYKQAEKLVYSR